eukprot:GHUV01002337.1.p2 GENE.GHUV01002337.1~~GHUV01002337.1.p2  ORF type:complete len:148 (+),score=33.95 GHUV01002337.1:178-621(+)
MAFSTSQVAGSTMSSRTIASRPSAVQRPTAHLRTPSQLRKFSGCRIQSPLLYTRQRQQSDVVCQGLFGLGLPEIAVIAGVAALIFGPSKLPELGKGLGKTVKSFQTAAKEFKTELEAAAAADDEPAAVEAAAKKQEELNAKETAKKE